MANVLVVDDLPDAADSFAELLSLFGHEVRVAYCAAQALSDIDQHAPDVVLADVDMPQIDGCELARRIRQRWGPRIRLVAHTGIPRENVIEDEIRAAARARARRQGTPGKDGNPQREARPPACAARRPLVAPVERLRDGDREGLVTRYQRSPASAARISAAAGTDRAKR